MSVPVMRPVLPDPERLLPRLNAVRTSGVYANLGPQVVELEARYAALLGVDPDRVVTTANATLGLEGAVRAAAAEDWAVPSFTFTATPSAVRSAGRRVRFVDVDPATWWLDPTVVPADHGLMPVAPFGATVDLGPWQGRRDVVIDAAASLGTLPDLGDLPPTWSVVLSLHATKVLGAGEGGLVVCGSAALAATVRTWTNFGLLETRESQLLGTNAKMSELQAVCAHAVLDDRAQELAEWDGARARMRSVAEDVGLLLAAQSRDERTPYCIGVLPDAARADRVERTLAAHGVGTRRWWARGCHRMPAYAGVPTDPLPFTEDLTGRTLGLPMFRALSDADATVVRTALREALD